MITRISGIPCEVELLHIYGRYVPAKTDADPSSCYEAEYPEVEFAVLDRKGRPADWLEAKMTEGEHRRITEELLTEHRLNQQE
jgi:hypothetical protein